MHISATASRARSVSSRLAAAASWIAVICLHSAASADTLKIGQQVGAVTKFSVGNPLTFNIGVTNAGATENISVANVVLEMDRGQGTTAPVVVQFFGGLGGTGSLLASNTVAASEIGTAFAVATFSLGSNVLMPAGGYSVRLSTTSSGVGSDVYQFKAGAMQLVTSSNSLLPTSWWVEDTNTTGTAGTSLMASGTVFAQYVLSSTAVNFGNYRLGATLTSQVGLVNNALATGNNVTQALAASGSTTGGVNSLTGLPSPYLSVNGTSNLTVGMTSAVAGPNSGNALLSFQSVSGTSATTGTTAIGSGTVAVTGTGWNTASISVSASTAVVGKYHVGATNVTGTVTVANSAPGSYSEGLLLSSSTTSGLATVGTLPGVIAAGGNASLSVGVTSVANVGLNNSGTVTLGLDSSGQGTSGLADLAIGSQVIGVAAQGYSGQSIWNIGSGGAWQSFDHWDVPGGLPGVDGALSVNDTATFAAGPTGATNVRLDGSHPVLTALTFSSTAASYSLVPGSGGSFTLGTPSNAASVTTTAGSHSIGAAIALARATTVSTAAGTVLTMAGAVSGSQNITKTGSGELAITGNGSLTGATSVAAGILRVNGAIADSPVAVAVGATLMGSGTIGGGSTVAGTHSPGNSPGIQTVDGNLTYQAGANVVWELINDTLLGRGTNYDGIDVTGGLDFAGNTSLDLVFNLAGSGVNWADAFWATSHTGTNGWLIYDGATSLSGFSNLAIDGSDWADGNAQMLQTVRDGASFDLYQEGNDVYLVYAVPEPSTILLAGLGIAALAAIRRLRR